MKKVIFSDLGEMLLIKDKKHIAGAGKMFADSARQGIRVGIISNTGKHEA